MESTQNVASRSKLVEDLQSVIRDAEALLKNTGEQADSQLQSAKTRFNATLQNAKTSLSNTQDSVVARSRDAAATADKYVQENPWRSVGAVAVAGLLIGLLLGRK